jgi:hypothetical protein
MKTSPAVANPLSVIPASGPACTAHFASLPPSRTSVSSSIVATALSCVVPLSTTAAGAALTASDLAS